MRKAGDHTSSVDLTPVSKWSTFVFVVLVIGVNGFLNMFPGRKLEAKWAVTQAFSPYYMTRVN